MGRFQELMQQYFERNLSVEEADELTRLLHGDPRLDAEALQAYETEHLLGFYGKNQKQPISIDLHWVQRVQVGLPDLENVFSPSQMELSFLAGLSQEALKPDEKSFDEKHRLADSDKRSEKRIKTFQKNLKTWGVGTYFKLATLCVILLVGSLLILSEWNPWSESRYLPHLPPFHPVARVNNAIGISWPENAETFKSGQSLENDRICFKSGLIELVWNNGVQIVLEGPIDLEILSDSDVRCHFGKLSAYVPPSGSGFEVRTVHGNIIDIGTRFSAVIDDEKTEVHVSEGRVKIENPRSGQEWMSNMLERLQSVKLSLQNVPANIPFDPDSYTTQQDVEEAADKFATEKRASWVRHRQRLQNDVSLLLYLDFEKQGRILANQSPSGSGDIPEAIIRNCRWTTGSRPWKHSLRFQQPGDAVSVTVPGRHDSLTFSASVRIDSLRRYSHSIFACNEADEGRVFWQLRHDGSIQFSVQESNAAPPTNYISAPLLIQKKWGVWYALTTVVDNAAKEIRHYVDGKRVAVLPMREATPVYIGSATLGNGFSDVRTASSRAFDGCFEEFLIFNRVLSDEEIADLTMQ